MTRQLLTALLITALTTPLLADSFTGDDKAAHFLASAFLTGALSYALTVKARQPGDRAFYAAAGITLSAGLVKEILDSKKTGNHFCIKDLFWDAAGVAAGSFNAFSHTSSR